MPGARVVDYTDQEVLVILDKEADEDGWASAEDIAATMGIQAHKNGNGKLTKPAQNVGIRLGWMKRFGFVTNHGGMWKMTARGATFMSAKLTSSQKAMLDKLPKEDVLDVMNVIGRRVYNGRDEMLRTAVRREFQYYSHTGQRVRAKRR